MTNPPLGTTTQGPAQTLASDVVAGSVNSYGEILKSTATIGGASIINVILGIIRTKILALLLGPAGLGLIGIYSTIIGMGTALAGMGLSGSGVRQIAEAVGTGDQALIARTVVSLRRTVTILGAGGALLLMLASHPISVLTFGKSDHWIVIALLGVTVYFGVVSGGQSALANGLRRIGDLARINILGGLTATLFCIPLVWFFRDRGIVPFLIVVPLATLFASWWYVRRIKIAQVNVSWRETWIESRSLFNLGFAFMASAFMAMGVGYLTRLLVMRHIGMDAAGHFQAAWALSGLYIGFILSAMGADFLPRLSEKASDNEACNRLVNQQAEVSLLMALPGVLATLTFAPLVIEIFYSGRFGPAVEVLRWQVLGVLVRVVSWPLGFILIAKGRSRTYLWTEVVSSGSHLLLLWFCIWIWGLRGAGIAFFGVNYLYWGMMILVARQISNFSWSTTNLRLIAGVSVSAGLVFGLACFLKNPWATICGSIATAAACVYCTRELIACAGSPVVPKWLRQAAKRFA